MREEHPVFDTDLPPESPVWRYLNFPKLVALLQHKALWFCRADLLGDPLEGSFTGAREAERQRLLKDPPSGQTREQLEKIFRHNAGWTARAPSVTYVNCWHLGDHESMAMWRGYGEGPYGIAIRSSFGLLNELLPKKFGELEGGTIFIGRVHYLDYSSETDAIPEEFNFYGPFVCKSLAYQHEQEIRAMFIDTAAELELISTKKPTAPGHLIPIDISFIQGITVSPLAPSWFDDVVRCVCRQFDCETEVQRSPLSAEPIY